MIKLKSDISFKKPKLKLKSKQILIPLISIAIVAIATGGFFVYKNIRYKKHLAATQKLLSENQDNKHDIVVKAAETGSNDQTQPSNPAQPQTTNSQPNQTTQPIAPAQPKASTQSVAGTSAPAKTTAPVPAPKPAPAPAPAPVYNPNQNYSVAAAQSYVESRLFTLINAERQRVGIAPLSYNATLGTAAEIRVDEESSLSFAGEDHVRPNGTSFSTVFAQVGYKWTRVGEHLIWGYKPPFTFSGTNLNSMADQMFTGWKNSPDHYANMINANYRETGFGVNLINSNGHTYYFGIQEFGTR